MARSLPALVLNLIRGTLLAHIVHGRSPDGESLGGFQPRTPTRPEDVTVAYLSSASVASLVPMQPDLANHARDLAVSASLHRS
jgi:hypothetical protein